MSGGHPVALVTGFGPFGPHAVNPSQRSVDALCELWPGPIAPFTAILPVTYTGAPTALRTLIAQYRPDLVVCTGVGRPGPTRLESQAARRVRSKTPDAAGDIGIGRLLSSEGPETRPAPWAAHALAAKTRTPTYPVEVSNDAGGYICDATLFTLSEAAPSTSIRGGFVHFPLSTTPAAIHANAEFLCRLLALLAHDHTDGTRGSALKGNGF